MTNAANYVTAADVFDSWHENVLAGEPPVLWPVGDGELARIEIGPGLIMLVGGAPGSGKTALAMQMTVDALRLTPSLRALVCNVEMPATVLMDRQLARLSGIDLEIIRHRRLAEQHADLLTGRAAGIAVYKQTVKRPELRTHDRVFWVWLSRLCSNWRSVLAIVQPETVNRSGFGTQPVSVQSPSTSA